MTTKTINCDELNKIRDVVSADIKQLMISIHATKKHGWFSKNIRIPASLNITEVYADIYALSEALDELRYQIHLATKEATGLNVIIPIPKHRESVDVKKVEEPTPLQYLKTWVLKKILR